MLENFETFFISVLFYILSNYVFGVVFTKKQSVCKTVITLIFRWRTSVLCFIFNCFCFHLESSFLLQIFIFNGIGWNINLFYVKQYFSVQPKKKYEKIKNIKTDKIRNYTTPPTCILTFLQLTLNPSFFCKKCWVRKKSNRDNAAM